MQVCRWSSRRQCDDGCVVVMIRQGSPLALGLRQGKRAWMRPTFSARRALAQCAGEVRSSLARLDNVAKAPGAESVSVAVATSGLSQERVQQSKFIALACFLSFGMFIIMALDDDQLTDLPSFLCFLVLLTLTMHKTISSRYRQATHMSSLYSVKSPARIRITSNRRGETRCDFIPSLSLGAQDSGWFISLSHQRYSESYSFSFMLSSQLANLRQDESIAANAQKDVVIPRRSKVSTRSQW